MITPTDKIELTEKRAQEPKEITFRCKYCDQDKPLAKMRTIRRFFPLVILCADCERKLHQGKSPG